MTFGSSKSTLVTAGLLAICFAALPSARADAIYTYTGNAFNEFFNGGACPPVCDVTGSFTVADPLAANLPELTLITPISFTLTSAGVTLTDGEPTDSSLYVATDATGAIVEWSWVEVGPAASPDARILTENDSSIAADDVRLGTNPPPFVGPRLGQISDDPGTWVETTTAVPEPGNLLLVCVGLLAIAGVARKRTAP